MAIMRRVSPLKTQELWGKTTYLQNTMTSTVKLHYINCVLHLNITLKMQLKTQRNLVNSIFMYK